MLRWSWPRILPNDVKVPSHYGPLVVSASTEDWRGISILEIYKGALSQRQGFLGNIGCFLSRISGCSRRIGGVASNIHVTFARYEERDSRKYQGCSEKSKPSSVVSYGFFSTTSALWRCGSPNPAFTGTMLFGVGRLCTWSATILFGAKQRLI